MTVNCHSFSHPSNSVNSLASAFRQPPCRYKEAGVRSPHSQLFSRLKKSCSFSLSSQKCSTSAVSAEHAAHFLFQCSTVHCRTMFKAGHCSPDAVYQVPNRGERSLPLMPWFMLLLVSPGCCQPPLLPRHSGSSCVRHSVPNIYHFWRLVHPMCKTSVLAEFSEVPAGPFPQLTGSLCMAALPSSRSTAPAVWCSQEFTRQECLLFQVTDKRY